MCCDNWNTFLQRTFKFGQNVCLGKILVKFKYGSSGVCLSVRPSVQPHFLCAAITGILFYRELSNCIWVIYQIRRTPIIFGSLRQKVKVTGNFFFFYIPFSNATLTQIHFDLLQTWNIASISDEGNTYSFWGHFVKGQRHGHFHGHFSGHNSYKHNSHSIQVCCRRALPDLVIILVFLTTMQFKFGMILT